jgi:hypothetical protein
MASPRLLAVLWALSAAARSQSLPPHPQEYKPDAGLRSRSAAEWSKTARALDWKELLGGPERVDYVGETHHWTGIAAEMSARMGDFKAAGINVLALELSRDKLQPLLDAWVKSGAREDELRRYFSTLADFAPEKYLGVLRSARAQGLRIVAIDGDFADPGAKLRERDRVMADNLVAILRDPRARVLVFCGMDHAQRAHQPRLLRELGWPSKSYAFLIGGLEYHAGKPDDVSAARVVSPEDYDLKAALDAAGLGSRRLFLPLKPSAEFDGYVSVPEVLAEKVADPWSAHYDAVEAREKAESVP